LLVKILADRMRRKPTGSIVTCYFFVSTLWWLTCSPWVW